MTVEICIDLHKSFNQKFMIYNQIPKCYVYIIKNSFPFGKSNYIKSRNLGNHISSSLLMKWVNYLAVPQSQKETMFSTLGGGLYGPPCHFFRRAARPIGISRSNSWLFSLKSPAYFYIIHPGRTCRTDVSIIFTKKLFRFLCNSEIQYVNSRSVIIVTLNLILIHFFVIILFHTFREKFFFKTIEYFKNKNNEIQKKYLHICIFA